MKIFGVWCAFAILGVLLGKEFLDWVWWYNWEDDDAENPARLLCAMWGAWSKLRDAHSSLRSRYLGPAQPRLTDVWRRFFPPKPYCEPLDQDGRTPTEWLLIEVICVWGMESWYKNEYDWGLKQKWDEFLNSPGATENPEAEELRSAEPAD